MIIRNWEKMNSKELKTLDIPSVPFLSGVVVAREAFVKSERATVIRFLRAYVEAIHFFFMRKGTHSTSCSAFIVVRTADGSSISTRTINNIKSAENHFRPGMV